MRLFEDEKRNIISLSLIIFTIITLFILSSFFLSLNVFLLVYNSSRLTTNKNDKNNTDNQVA